MKVRDVKRRKADAMRPVSVRYAGRRKIDGVDFQFFDLWVKEKMDVSSWQGEFLAASSRALAKFTAAKPASSATGNMYYDDKTPW